MHRKPGHEINGLRKPVRLTGAMRGSWNERSEQQRDQKSLQSVFQKDDSAFVVDFLIRQREFSRFKWWLGHRYPTS